VVWWYMNNEQTVDQNSRSSSELLHFRGSRPLFGEELYRLVEAGARCVRFEFCFSLLFVTVRRQSAVYLTNSWQERYLRGLGYSFLALLLGPWGVPWGLFWTPWAIWVNATGGADCTREVLAELESGRTVPPVEQVNAQHGEVHPL
jgi:hypothetical protein